MSYFLKKFLQKASQLDSNLLKITCDYLIAISGMRTSVKLSNNLCIWIVLILQTVSVLPESYHGQTMERETGFEFVQKDHQIELDDAIFFEKDKEVVEHQEERSVLEIIRTFIRSAKGLPSEMDGEYPILVSGTEMNDKPAYCFYPYLVRKLVKIEFKIYELLMEFQEKAKGISIPVLDSYLKDFEESSLRAKRKLEILNNSEDPNLYIATHPLLIYRLVRRYAEDLQPIFKMVSNLQPEWIHRLYQEANPELLVFPTKDDLDDALNMISRMQDGNNLNTYKIARGIFENIDTGLSLNALHCLEIGAFYLDEKNYAFSIKWFHNALEMARKSKVVQNHVEILEFFNLALRLAVNQHNNEFHERLASKWDTGIFNSTVSLPFEPTKYIRRIIKLNEEALQNRHLTDWNWATRANFRRVCSGENLQSEAEKAFLKCWYNKQPNPYWYINPLKAELLHMNPPVLQIYDFIGDKLVEHMKETAVTQLKRSMVEDSSKAADYKVDSSRTSSQTWLNDTKESTFLQPLTRKLEMMSGLTIMPSTSSDPYQVAAYGPSHHYEAHIDAFEDFGLVVDTGNRITTIMGYLSDVPAGGRTGFPVLGIASEPIKGSIVMWNNLKRNGEERDERTWHGGCPVVLGVKWITNKWVYYKENFRNFHCTLNPTD